jgi:hypothetical protein
MRAVCAFAAKAVTPHKKQINNRRQNGLPSAALTAYSGFMADILDH